MDKKQVRFLLILMCVFPIQCAGNFNGTDTNSSNISELCRPETIPRNPVEPCRQKANLRNTLLGIFCVVVLIIGIIGNSLSIFVILMSRQLRKQISYIFLASLAFADLGVSFFITSVKIDMYKMNGNFCHGMGLCVFQYMMDSFFPVVSVFHLLIIGIDRWFAISHPFAYITHMTVKRAKYILSVVWFLTLFWACMGMFDWSTPSKFSYNITKKGVGRFCYSQNEYYQTTTVSLIYIIPMSVTTCLYAIILRIALKQAAAISKTSMDKKRPILGEIKAAKTVSVVFAAYIICWLPHITIVLIQYWNGGLLCAFLRSNHQAYDVVTTVISNVLPVINSCVNPFIYFITGEQFRNSFKVLQRKLMNKQRNVLLQEHYEINSKHNGTMLDKKQGTELNGTYKAAKESESLM